MLLRMALFFLNYPVRISQKSCRATPKVVNTIYQIIHVPDNTLLSNEIIPAAEAAEQGASVQEISDMAADGLFGGGPMPTLKM